MIEKQRTIKESFTLKGKGLHSGVVTTLTFHPAPSGYGRRIKRVDLEGTPEFEAIAENVVETSRGTVIAKGDAKVSTIEHAMAALYAYNVDNCLMEVDGPEFPILDGSAAYYVEALERVGTEEQTADRDYFVVHERIEYKDEATGSSIVILPSEKFSANVLVTYPSPILSNQFATMNDFSEFKSEISSCRTFVFVREIAALLKMNLIKGGDLDNAIVIYDQEMSEADVNELTDTLNMPRINVSDLGYLQKRPLAFDNEPARHKLLDLIGDLSLIGKPLKGHVIATCPGHKVNTDFAKKIYSEIKKQGFVMPYYNPAKEPLLDLVALKKLLPHRWPFLLIDKIIEIRDRGVVGVKNVTGNEDFFQGHFPDEPVMPGVLLVEAMAQTAGILVLTKLEEPERYSTYLLKIDNVKFRNKVVPGDTVIFKVDLMTEIRRGSAYMKGYAIVANKIAVEAEFFAQVVKNK